MLIYVLVYVNYLFALTEKIQVYEMRHTSVYVLVVNCSQIVQ